MSITFSQLAKKVDAFDFSTLDFHGGINKIFYNTRTDKFLAYPDNTDVEVAERQNPVIFLGELGISRAKQGRKPDIREWEDQIKFKTGEHV